MIFWIRKPVSINGHNFCERQQKGRRLRVEHILFCLFSEIQLTSVIWEDKAWRTHQKKCKRETPEGTGRTLDTNITTHPTGQILWIRHERKKSPSQQSAMEFFCNFWSSVSASKVITSSSLKSTTAACARYLHSLVRVCNSGQGSNL